MATYAEYLKLNGATDEEIKLLDTSIARRAYDRMEESLVAKDAAAKKAVEDAKAYEARVNSWFDDTEKNVKKTESELIAAKARLAAADTALRTAHEKGMLDVAKDLGYNFDNPPAAPKNDAPPAIDISKFLTVDSARPLLDSAGDGLAVLQDIVLEHMQLFPNQPLKVRELRNAAVKANKTVEQYWLETFKVPEARATQAKKIQEAHEANLRKQITEQVQAEFASKYGNPDLRPLAPSQSFLVPRKDAGREKQPWESGFDGEGGSNDRVRRATANALKAQATGTTH